VALTVNVLARETLVAREDDCWLRIECAWGVDPSVAFLPSASEWEGVVPDWLLGRRAELVEVIEQFGLVVRDAFRPLSSHAFGRGEVPNSADDPIASITTLEAVPIEELRRREGDRR
jgi:hypothetical protein